MKFVKDTKHFGLRLAGSGVNLYKFESGKFYKLIWDQVTDPGNPWIRIFDWGAHTDRDFINPFVFDSENVWIVYRQNPSKNQNNLYL